MKRLFKVTAMTGLLTLLKMAMGFVIAKVVAIYTGPTGMAMLGQVQSMVGSLNGIINAPAGSGVVRFTAEYKEQGFDACAPWWRAALQWVLIISAIAIPVGLLFAKPIASGILKDVNLAWVVMATVIVLPFRNLMQFGDQRPAVISPLCRAGYAFSADLGLRNVGHDCLEKY